MESRDGRRTRRGRRNFRRQVITLVNVERRKHGLRPLKPSKPLRLSATAKARDMVKYHYFNHDTPRGAWYRLIYRIAGDRWRELGENIARGQDTAEQVVEEWMDSPLHRDNILASKYKLIGIGFARDGSTEYWCQHFGTAG